MNDVVKGLLRTAQEQVFGRRRSQIWTAFTKTGKVVVIESDRVVKIIDPKKGGHAK